MNGCNCSQSITLVRGNSLDIPFLLTGTDGEPYLLGDGDFVRLVVKPAYYKDAVIDKKAYAADQSADGIVTIRLKPADTLSLEVGAYKYDLGLQTGENFYTPVTSSPFNLSENQSSYEAVTG